VTQNHGSYAMLVGYARVSTADQNLDLQLNALRAAGAERIVTEQASGSRVNRPGLMELYKVLRPGDTLVVWKLDRLSRSLRDLLDIINQLHGREVGFQSLTEKIDTTSAGGKLIFHVIGALAEFERSMIVERTNAGLDAARKRGVRLGPPEKISAEQWQVIKDMIAEDRPIAQIARLFNVHRMTIYRRLATSDH
jgi:DNA invertase Pin-like site-specific DNA recombinase